MKDLHNRLFHFFTFFLISLCFISALSVKASEEKIAQSLDAQITISDGSDSSVLKDQYASSKLTLAAGTQIQIEAPSAIGGIYLIWDAPVPNWTLQAGTTTSSHGENGFLHEYVALKQPSNSITIQIPETGAVLCDITILSPGILPSHIQVWEPPCEKADLLLLSTHADDEHLFFGGTMPYYAGEKGMRVQLVYFCSHAANEPYREHEKLNGMWLEGVTNYPIMGDFPDEYSTSLETALTQYNYDEAVRFVVTQLRRFQPQVVLGQDLNGEYGHGSHCLTAKALTDAIPLSNQPDYDPQSIEQYGLWDVPKTYLHLYPENPIHMNWNIPLERFGGQTALQMADAGYKTHESQQWCWFYVSDAYEYSCAEFGLFRSLVGPDVIGGDFMENLVPYDQQEAAEEETTTETVPEETTTESSSSHSAKESLPSSKEPTTNNSDSQEFFSQEEVQNLNNPNPLSSWLSKLPVNPEVIFIAGILLIIAIVLIIVIRNKKTK